jgi:Sec-independent protein translocase protein TatA
MSFFGLGGFEVLLIGAIALFVLGPKRLLEGIREGRKIYTDLKRQRDALQTLITEAIDLEDLKKQVDLDGLTDSVKSLESDLAFDQVADDVRKSVGIDSSSIPRDGQYSRPPIEVDSEIRDAIPDLDLSSASDDDASGDEDSPVERESGSESGSDADEVKS